MILWRLARQVIVQEALQRPEVDSSEGDNLFGRC